MESLFSALPVLLLLLICPIAMLFMMRGAHGGHAGGQEHRSAPDASRLMALEAEVAELRRAAGRAPEVMPTSENGSGQPPVEVKKG